MSIGAGVSLGLFFLSAVILIIGSMYINYLQDMRVHGDKDNGSI